MEEKAKNMTDEKKPYLMLTRRKTIGWFIIILFVFGWMFILGIMVGRGTAPVQFDIKSLKKDITAEVTSAVGREKEELMAKINALMDRLTSSGKQDLGFYEDLSSMKESPENINVKDVEKRGATSFPGPAHTDSSPKVTEIAETEKKIIAKEPSGQVFTIQVASGKNQQSADKMVDELIKKGYQAYRSSGEIKGKGVWHRVRIGEFDDRGRAESVLSKLKKDKFNGIIVTK